MWLWSRTRYLNLVCLSVSSIWLVENQRFRREYTRQTKKVAWSSTFLRTIFSAWADFFLTIQSVMCMLKGGKLYRSGKVSMLESGLKVADLKPATLLKRNSCEFCETFMNAIFIEHLQRLLLERNKTSHDLFNKTACMRGCVALLPWIIKSYISNNLLFNYKLTFGKIPIK